ncbi:hypothetical protein N431DRAFT_445744 [Stipitochalara longipes BDJ]|nr:hypothetical protein N431DRAFT_445744 [Stipitochalara longipes BDJ]
MDITYSSYNFRFETALRRSFGKLAAKICRLPNLNLATVKIAEKEQKLVTIAHKLQYSFCEDPVTLQVPDFSSCPSSPEPSRCAPYTDYVKDHILFRAKLQQTGQMSPEGLRKLSHTELKGVQKALPEVDSREIVLAMTAWFCTLCAVDDVVEKIDCDSAARVLRLCNSKSLQDPTSFLVGVMQAFAAHAAYLLPGGTCMAFFNAIRGTLEGQTKELKYRSKLCSSMRTYEKIRNSSIGIMPFFILLEIYLCGPAHQPSRKIQRLKDLVISTVVLQNDMVGLEKDLQSGELMNSVLVVSGLEGFEKENQRNQQTLERAVRHIGDKHNSIIGQALLTANAVRKTSETMLANHILSFSHNHLLWAMHTTRYHLEVINS